MSSKNTEVDQLPLEPQSKEIVVTQEPSVPELMRFAIEQLGGEGAENAVNALEKLVALKERQEDRQAERDFAKALAEFQAVCPDIPKSSVVDVTTRSGKRIYYRFAPFDVVVSTVRPFLTKYGFAFTVDSEVVDNQVKAVVTLWHEGGHAKSATFQCPVDTGASMNISQQYGAALAYAKRYALLEVIGIATSEIDTDAVSPELIDDNQIADMEAILDEIGGNKKENKDKFLNYMGVTQISDIRKVNAAAAFAALNKKRAAK